MPSTVDIVFGEERLTLNADHTVWWPGRRILLAADLHAGKTEHMRRYGVAIPNGSLESDLSRLAKAVQAYSPKKLIFLGDLFHSEINSEWDLFASWCQQQPCSIGLVKGNHDRFVTLEMLKAAHIETYSEPYNEPPFILSHHPQAHPAQPTLAGHVHPTAFLYGTAKERWRLPCFWLQTNQLVLPSFGSFTGGSLIYRHNAQAIYCCSPDFKTILTVKN